MKRFLFSLFFYVIVGRWLYAEALIVCPSLVPSIDHLLSTVEIPTHNTWSREKVEQAFGEVNAMFNRVSESIPQFSASSDNGLRRGMDRALVRTSAVVGEGFDTFNDSYRDL